MCFLSLLYLFYVGTIMKLKMLTLQIYKWFFCIFFVIKLILLLLIYYFFLNLCTFVYSEFQYWYIKRIKYVQNNTFTFIYNYMFNEIRAKIKKVYIYLDIYFIIIIILNQNYTDNGLHNFVYKHGSLLIFLKGSIRNW